MYFYLNENSFLVLGPKKSAIYDMQNNELYTLDEESTKYLTLSEQGKEIDEYYNKTSIFKDLEEAKLGFSWPTKCFIDKIRVFNNSTSRRKDLTFPYVKSAFIMLNNKCSAKCKDCSKMFCPICLCKEGEEKDKELSVEKWSEIIESISRVGLKEIVFTGGEALLYKDLNKLIELALSHNLSVNVVVNGKTPIDKSISRNINIVLVAFEEKKYDDIIESLKEFNSAVIKCNDSKRCNDINKLILEKKLENIAVSNVETSEPIRTINDITPFDIYSYDLKKNYDSCLYGKLYLDYKGNVVPCFNQIDKVLGNLAVDDFNDVINNLIDKYWYVSKYTSKCSKCELIYACTACKCYDSDKNCTYDILEGVWK